jgi:hypothetical protein
MKNSAILPCVGLEVETVCFYKRWYLRGVTSSFKDEV